MDATNQATGVTNHQGGVSSTMKNSIHKYANQSQVQQRANRKQLMIVDGTGGTIKSRKKNNIPPLAPNTVTNGFMSRSNDSTASLQAYEESGDTAGNN